MGNGHISVGGGKGSITYFSFHFFTDTAKHVLSHTTFEAVPRLKASVLVPRPGVFLPGHSSLHCCSHLESAAWGVGRKDTSLVFQEL